MKAKHLLIVGLAAGYVLGARAGRERYEQIRDKSRELWESPQVVRRRKEAADYAKRQAPVVRAKAEGLAKAAPGAVADGARAVAGAATEAADDATAAVKKAASKTVSTAQGAVDKTVATAREIGSKASDAVKKAATSVTSTAKRERKTTAHPPGE